MTFHIQGTQTGRIQCTKPNYRELPRTGDYAYWVNEKREIEKVHITNFMHFDGAFEIHFFDRKKRLRTIYNPDLLYIEWKDAYNYIEIQIKKEVSRLKKELQEKSNELRKLHLLNIEKFIFVENEDEY